MKTATLHRSRRWLMLSLLSTMLGGCADTALNMPPLVLRDEALPHIGNTHLYTVVAQTQLQAGSSTAALGIDKARLISLLKGPLAEPAPATEAAPVTDSSSELQALREAVHSYDFDQSLQTVLQAQLQPIIWLRLQDAQGFKQPPAIKAVPAPAGNSALWVVARYELSADLTTLTITAQCALTPPPRPGSASGQSPFSIEQQFDDAAYRNQLSYAVRLAAPSPTRSGNAEQWRVHDAAALRTVLTRGIGLISETLALDLQQQIPRSSANKQLADGEYAPVVRSVGSAVLFRYEDGALKYFDTLDAATLPAQG